MKPKTYSLVLVNAAEMALQHPETFSRPSNDELATILPGDVVKISDGTERFWVSVVKRESKTILIGKIDNYLCPGKGYDSGDLVRFSADNVYEIHQ